MMLCVCPWCSAAVRHVWVSGEGRITLWLCCICKQSWNLQFPLDDSEDSAYMRTEHTGIACVCVCGCVMERLPGLIYSPFPDHKSCLPKDIALNWVITCNWSPLVPVGLFFVKHFCVSVSRKIRLTLWCKRFLTNNRSDHISIARRHFSLCCGQESSWIWFLKLSRTHAQQNMKTGYINISLLHDAPSQLLKIIINN